MSVVPIATENPQERVFLVEFTPTTPDPAEEVDGGTPSSVPKLILDGGDT